MTLPPERTISISKNLISKTPSNSKFINKSNKDLNAEKQARAVLDNEQLKLINHLKAENTHLKLQKLKELKQNNAEYKEENEKDYRIDQNNPQINEGTNSRPSSNDNFENKTFDYFDNGLVASGDRRRYTPGFTPGYTPGVAHGNLGNPGFSMPGTPLSKPLTPFYGDFENDLKLSMTDRTDVFEDLHKRHHSMVIKTKSVDKKLPILSHKHHKASSFNTLASKPPTGHGGGSINTPAGGLNPLYPARHPNAPARVNLSFDDLNNAGGPSLNKNNGQYLSNSKMNNKYAKNNPSDRNNSIKMDKNNLLSGVVSDTVLIIPKSSNSHEKLKFGGNFNTDQSFSDTYDSHDEEDGDVPKLKKENSLLQSKLFLVVFMIRLPLYL
jgi:hypothetical protein